MSRYKGDPGLRDRVVRRDRLRCRWCGVTNRGGHVHHIRYRRGHADDVAENLITLCPHCHDIVHGLIRTFPISKEYAQDVLFRLVGDRSTTGLSLIRRDRRKGREEAVELMGALYRHHRETAVSEVSDAANGVGRG